MDKTQSGGTSAELIRSPEQSIETRGIFSVLNGQATIYKCDTLELAWKNNTHKISCIPPGVYIVKKVAASEHIPYPHFSVTGVSGRDGICIHKANFAAGAKIDLLGCIAPGHGYSDINKDGIADIINSGTALAELMAILPEEFKLTIK